LQICASSSNPFPGENPASHVGGNPSVIIVSLTDFEDDFNIVQATIANSKVSLLLDSGAQISVFPENVVPSRAKTG